MRKVAERKWYAPDKKAELTKEPLGKHGLSSARIWDTEGQSKESDPEEQPHGKCCGLVSKALMLCERVKQNPL